MWLTRLRPGGNLTTSLIGNCVLIPILVRIDLNQNQTERQIAGKTIQYRDGKLFPYGACGLPQPYTNRDGRPGWRTRGFNLVENAE